MKPRRTRPNILFIISDQHSAKVLGHKKHPDVKTPNFDRMAAEGVRFDNAISQCPICTPSRVSFLSGQYRHNHGTYGLSGPKPHGLPTLLGHFRRAGYTTAAIGKIHCPEYWIEDDSDYFTEVYPRLAIGNFSEYEEYLKEKGLYELRDDNQFKRQKDERKRIGGIDARVSDLKYEDCVEAWTARQTITFMENAVSRDKPFLAHCSLPRPHQWYFPSEPFWSMYNENELRLPPNSEYDQSLKAPHLRHYAEVFRKNAGNWIAFEPKTFEAARLRKLHGYLGCVSLVDHAVGEILSWLEKRGLEENTIVIYTSDHGDYACEHGLMEKAPGICSDAITRIPFIWQWKGRFKEGHVANEIVESVDLSTTLCSLAGIEALETSDGRDISHLLKGESGSVHKIGVTEFAWSKSVRKGKYRYVYYPLEMFAEVYPEGFSELYDLEEDPWEMRNLSFNPEYAHVVQELKSDLLEWLITTKRPATVLGGDQIFSGSQAVTRFRHSINPDGKINPERLKKISGGAYL